MYIIMNNWMKLKEETSKWMMEYRSIPKQSCAHPMVYHKLNLTEKKLKKITLLARNRSDDLAHPIGPWLIAKKPFTFFVFSWNVLCFWKHSCFPCCNKNNNILKVVHTKKSIFHN